MTEELLELVEMEVRELLSEYDFPGDDLPIIQGSALKALEAKTTASWERRLLRTAVKPWIHTSQSQSVLLTSHS